MQIKSAVIVRNGAIPSHSLDSGVAEMMVVGKPGHLGGRMEGHLDKIVDGFHVAEVVVVDVHA